MTDDSHTVNVATGSKRQRTIDDDSEWMGDPVGLKNFFLYICFCYARYEQVWQGFFKEWL